MPQPQDANEIARLRWRCRRGMRELDLLVGGWLDYSYAGASAEMQAGFRQLLEMPDPLLYAWLTGRGRPDDPVLAGLINTMRGKPV